MSAWHGPAGRGARASLREAKRDEATARNAATPAERRASARRPCVTGKHGYDTEARARAELVGAVIAKNRGDQRRHECRVYQCDLCGKHHLTSKPQRPSKESTR
jgi:hypothetical protein